MVTEQVPMNAYLSLPEIVGPTILAQTDSILPATDERPTANTCLVPSPMITALYVLGYVPHTNIYTYTVLRLVYAPSTTHSRYNI